MAELGILPDNGTDVTLRINQIIDSIRVCTASTDSVEFVFEKGRYDLYPREEMAREYYISNHDQVNPKYVGMDLSGFKHMKLNGAGAEFICHGRMLPIAMTGSDSCSVSDLSIDFDNPQIAQIEILENDTIRGEIKYKPAQWVKYDVSDSVFTVFGDGWRIEPSSGIAFEHNTRHLVYCTSDIAVGTRGVTEGPDGTISAPWNNPRLIPGTVVAMRNYERPAPAIFVADCNGITLENINVHYAEGMGFLAQMSSDVTLKGFNVCLRGEDDPRYFTTQADATHFSGCKGHISSTGGLYEGMMDDAINVHGTYLKVMERIDSNKLRAQYMHHQSYGFRWGEPGDSVQYIASNTMEIIGSPNIIKSILPVDSGHIAGVKIFDIEFESPVPATVAPENGTYGIENLTWTPSVYFAENIIRNNRARGSLFSTPRKVVAENNLFDHTSGTAILLCGDCNGWFETGACKDVVIRKNKFINALTNLFQFTNAVISIYPEIPDLDNQKKPFHHGIIIEENEFVTFDKPLLYAKSVDSLIFRNNTVIYNSDYPSFHWNKEAIRLEKVTNAEVEMPTDQSYK